MPKDELYSARPEQKSKCVICGVTEPYHSLVCPNVKGKNCHECQAVMPRHYPWCSYGQRDGFYCWQVPLEMQFQLEEHYQTHMKKRLAQRVSGEKE